MPCDRVPVAKCETSPQTGLNVVCANTLEFIFDSPEHDVLVAREQVHTPFCVIREIFFDIGETGDRFAFGEVFAV